MFGDKGSSKISSIRSPKSKFDSEMKRDATLRIYLHNSRKKNFSLLLPLQWNNYKHIRVLESAIHSEVRKENNTCLVETCKSQSR